MTTPDRRDGLPAAMNFEVKLANGKVVEWTGSSGEEAARRASDCLGVAVVAWRHPRYEFIPGVHHSQIVG